MSIGVRVYKGKRYPDAYLFVATDEDLSRVPDKLLQRMGNLSVALEMELTGSQSLARVSADIVISAIDQRGFYLQLPPAADQFTVKR